MLSDIVTKYQSMEKNLKIQSVLEGLGLNDVESKVYISMLSLGPATVLSISRASETKRTTIYGVLESLNRKGLARTEVKGLKKLYVAEHPKKLENMLELKRTELQSLLPQLESMYNLQAEGSFIKYYEGTESIRNVYFDLLESLEHNDEFLVIGDPDLWETVNKNFATEFIKRRNKKKLQIRMILSDSELAHKYKEFERNFQEEIKFLLPESKIETNVVITPRRLVIQQMYAPVLAVTIENKSLIHLHRELFNVMWTTL